MATAPPADRGEAIAAAALAWYVRTKDPSASAADRAALQAWLAADPAHARAFAETETLWRELALPAAALATDGWHRRPRRIAPRFAWAAAAALALAVGIAGWRDPGLGARLLADHAAAPGATLTIRMDDGSRLLLDGDSAVDVDADRRVTLRRGRAWFEVAPATRDFVVHAGATRVRVLGTAFAVTRQGEQVDVTVARGRVAVSAPQLNAPVELQRDQRLLLAPNASAEPAAVDAETALAWRRGLLIFDGAPLAEVAAELDRVLPGRVLVGDGTGGLTVSGVFRRDDPEAMLAALRDGFGLEITRVAGLAVLLQRR